MANSLETAKLLLKDTLAIHARSIQTAEMLLEQVSVIRKRCEAQYREKGTAYNIFKIAKIHKDERKMCRVFVDLLNPKGLHYQGSLYLNLFMEEVVRRHIKGEVKLNPGKEKVIREYPTDKGKHIDIVISDKKVFIPIEAKIDAPDSQKQLINYAAFSKKMNPSDRSIPVLFLTRYGHKSEKAKENEEYVPISFEKDIVSWLQACLEKTDKAEPVREVIKQYIKAIKSFCGIMEDEEMEKAIKELIMTSEENYEAALNIRNAVTALIDLDFDKKLRKIFKDQILKRVKEEFPDHGVRDYADDSLWLIVDLKNRLQLSVTSDVKTFVVEKLDPKEKVDGKKKKDIIEKMSGMLDVELDVNEQKNWKSIWAGTNVRHPDIEAENDDMYWFKLCQIYKDDPQAVADWLVSIAKELEQIKG